MKGKVAPRTNKTNMGSVSKSSHSMNAGESPTSPCNATLSPPFSPPLDLICQSLAMRAQRGLRSSFSAWPYVSCTYCRHFRLTRTRCKDDMSSLSPLPTHNFLLFARDSGQAGVSGPPCLDVHSSQRNNSPHARSVHITHKRTSCRAHARPHTHAQACVHK